MAWGDRMGLTQWWGATSVSLSPLGFSRHPEVVLSGAGCYDRPCLAHRRAEIQVGTEHPGPQRGVPPHRDPSATPHEEDTGLKPVILGLSGSWPGEGVKGAGG